MIKKIRAWVRKYLRKNTPVTLITIEDGTPGEFSKIEEEFLELEDAIKQKNKSLTLIETFDLMDSTAKFQWAHFRVPLLVAVLAIYLRRLYKPIRNRIYDFAGLSKEDFNTKICPECDGGGMIAKLYPKGHTEVNCEKCHGEGKL